ncbi:stage II sporulation protein M [Virgibacillus pantothenticus]|uniref:stage II sporulation protein M n=1 Tax=Virgibacillus pantothenticus TaxID=1473 RepID=UPI001C212024|nr:stage II sporulation protein M [Virgibacillus pantothenticus]MBU8565449.1 stage II sporulation protein M [Virgibacillus pantothenticus]MBU8599749.1 stage II sporulation protein M [Virgibacillus pantothenticus]MBU8634196.1 stage II sporulation protein M [Virgibacillus pantothenticus]MBU8641490.1 stage II sporulation protein M [Virgibacillus pantothenticus]MBU8646057.1 stage II sporulation protein M [Virgibacillus pantothenticus]
MHKNKTLLINHVKEHATIYLFMVILFLTGIIFGAILVNSMNFVQKQDLFFYLERFFKQVTDNEQAAYIEIFKNSFFYHIKYLLLLFVLGLSVIGLPLVWILIFLKGLVVGFSVGFMVNQLGMNGLFLASLSIAPQNFLIIPVYIIAGSLAMIFSLTLLSKLFSNRIAQPVFQPFGRYVLLFSLLILFASIAALLETFVSNEAMQWMVRSFY